MIGDTAPTPEELGAKRPLLTPGATIAFIIGLALTLVVLWRLGVFSSGPNAVDLAKERKIQEFRDAEKKLLESGAAKKIDDAMDRIANDPKARP